ncbi:MAG: hypothetical protein AVDCRST_MAG30-4106, partial [uncultured Solirubrobacteraceae bacterium]
EARPPPSARPGARPPAHHARAGDRARGGPARVAGRRRPPLRGGRAARLRARRRGARRVRLGRPFPGARPHVRAGRRRAERAPRPAGCETAPVRGLGAAEL